MTSRALEKHLDQIERHVAAVRELVFGSEVQAGQGDAVGTYDHLDRSRRRRPEWLPRGIVFELIEQRGGSVEDDEYEQIVLTAGYKDVRAVNRFFKGEPEPVLERNGDSVQLTERGRSAAAFFRSWWLPQLLAGTVAWPTTVARQLLGGR
jgi:hypothetical protein